MAWQDVGSADEVTEETPLSASIAGRAVGIYVLAGKYYALENICPHADAFLTDGFVEGEEIECPLHGARFHIPSGKLMKEPGERDLVQYEIKREGDRLLVRVD